MKPGDISLRRCKPEDLPAILDLFAKVMFNYRSFPYAEFWTWKHYANPFGPSPILVAEIKEKIVGIRTFMRWHFVRQTHSYIAFRAVDTVTDPEHRGAGIFKRLTLALLEEISSSEPHSFIYNTPNEQSMPGYLKMGWEIAGRPAMITYPVFPAKKVSGLWDSLHQNLLSFSWQTVSLSQYSNERFQTDLTPAYLKWRYADFPLSDYGLILDKDMLLIVKIKSYRYFKELRICDVVAASPWVLNTVFSLAKPYAQKLGCQLISAVEPSGIINYTSIFHFQFPVQHWAPYITMKKTGDDKLYREVMDLNNWRFSSGSLELF